MLPGAGSGKPATERTRIRAEDGNPHAPRHMRDVLARTGYGPILAGEPEEVDRLIGEKRPRPLLPDTALPGTDAIELTGRVLEKTELPVFFRLRAGGRY